MAKFVRRPAFAVAIAAMALVLAACAPKLYTINLSPPHSVGSKFSLYSDISEKSASHAVINLPGISSPQHDDRNEEFIGHLEGDGEVLGVFPNRGIQKISLTVKVIQITRGGTAVKNLPAHGAKIVASRQGDKIAISVDDKPVDTPVADALNELIWLDDEKSSTQECFGPKSPVKIGATWTVDPGVVEDILKSGLGGGAKDASGTMKLEAVNGSGENQAAKLTGDFAIKAYKPELPSTMQVDFSSIFGAMSWTVPTNSNSKGVFKFNRALTIMIHAHGSPNGGSLTLGIDGNQDRFIKITFL